jgi:DNA-binding SARP family transcriptional activator
LAIGTIYLDMGQDELALEALAASVDGWKGMGKNSREFALANFHLARAHAKLGDTGKALALMESSLETAARLGYDQFLVNAGRRDMPFMHSMASVLGSPQLVSLLKRIEEFQPGKAKLGLPAIDARRTETHLEVKGFGLGEVHKGGQIIPNVEWRSTRAKALFFYVVDKNGARKDEIALEFWPDFDTPKVSSNFHATLWRVRRALSDKDLIVFEDGKYKISSDVTISYDVQEFSDLLKQSENQKTPKAGRIELLQRAIDLYQGDFLDDIFMDWSDQRRRELQEDYLSVLILLADLELEQSRYVEVKELSQKALSLDPYREQAHYALMQALAQSGSPASALAHYRKYQERLQKDLAVEPSDELKNLYAQLSSS